MTEERELYLGALKFIFFGLLINAGEPVTAPVRRIMWAIAKDRALSYCESVHKN